MYNTGSTDHKCYECMFSLYKSEGKINNLLTSYHTRIYNTSFTIRFYPPKNYFQRCSGGYINYYI